MESMDLGREKGSRKREKKTLGELFLTLKTADLNLEVFFDTIGYQFACHGSDYMNCITELERFSIFCPFKYREEVIIFFIKNTLSRMANE